MDTIYQSTVVAPVLNNRKYLFESYLNNNSLPIPEPGDPAYTLNSALRGLARGLNSGDVIHFIQTIDIELAINVPHKIDIDYRYFKPKNYCGTYQILGGGGVRVGQTGFLEIGNGNNRILHKFQIQILNELEPIKYMITQQQFVQQLDMCNFELLPGIIIDPSSGGPVAGFFGKFQEPDRPAGTIKSDYRFFWDGDTTTYPFGQMGNTGTYFLQFDFTSCINELGLYIYEGCEIVSITEAIGIDAIVPRIIPPSIVRSTAEFPLCGLATGPDCDDEFDSFIANDPNAFDGEAPCLASGAVQCEIAQWQCPSDATDIRDYWQPVLR